VISDAIKALVAGRDLSASEVEAAMDSVLDGAASGGDLLVARHLAQGEFVATWMCGGPPAVGGGERSHRVVAGDTDDGVAQDLAEFRGDGDGDGGIYHFLAISGLHVSILSVFIYFIFKKISCLFSNFFNFIKINISYLIILFLIIYNFIVGEKSAMIRASIMFSISLFAKDLHKDFRRSNIFFIAYIICILIFEFGAVTYNLYTVQTILSLGAIYIGIQEKSIKISRSINNE
jgi:hypothetical protein